MNHQRNIIAQLIVRKSSIHDQSIHVHIDEKTFSLPSEHEQTDTAPWENSSANTTIMDHGNTFQLLVDQLQQRLSLEKYFSQKTFSSFFHFRNTRTANTIIDEYTS